jgi:four helix bundle protein
VQHFANLVVWQRAHSFVLEVYRRTAAFPREERYGLTSQLRRAAASVAANIAEGAKRRSETEFARHLNIAEASLAESAYFVLLARDLGYLPSAAAASLESEADEIARMLHRLRERIVDP